MKQHQVFKSIAIAALVSSCSHWLGAQDPFAANVRPTEPLTGAEQQETFKLPAGFEIQLVAAEPDILKPLNMAFDARGRLWITNSVEYPYAAPADRKGRDSIKVLEDTDGDGRADKITTFADGLNIPMGIYPYHDGVIVFSIPNIWKLQDTDGDGRADKRTKLYGPFGFERDTHGLNNAFRRGFDGWLYACHGFNNQTTVAGGDGRTVTMQSGNTYRMRLDGSRIEQFTWGQVNPFGMTFDPLGNLFTADCHSKPLYQLLRGGYYPSFGKPHDGLGFVPPMMNHLHGSTAIAGVALYTGKNFPREFRENMFTGNVMTSRVNRNSLVRHGSTITAKQEEDFVSTTDPWFRPVDIRVGPDGALYIADFYNRIIGHYEVPLDHPQRDRHRGRIWRIVYRGDAGESKPAKMPTPLDEAAPAELIAALSHSNLGRRQIAMDLLVDKFGDACAEEVEQAAREADSPIARAHAYWTLHRIKGDTRLLVEAARDKSAVVRIHAMKMIAETRRWTGAMEKAALAGLNDSNAFVQRAAADALGQRQSRHYIRPLLDLLEDTPKSDTHLRHTARMALRDQLGDEDMFIWIEQAELDDKQTRAIADVALGSRTAATARYLVNYIARNEDIDRELLLQYMQHAARFVEAGSIDHLIDFVERMFGADLNLQVSLLTSITRALDQRGKQPSQRLQRWGKEVARQLFGAVAEAQSGWTNGPIDGQARKDNPWVVQKRASADGDRSQSFLSSLPSGEQATGMLRSRAFDAPKSLSFYVAGHIGNPSRPVIKRNFVRLRDAATGQLLVEITPPRNDVAQLTKWDLSKHEGRSVVLEIVDGDARGAYAWLAIGRFDPAVVQVPEEHPRLTAQRRDAAIEIARKLKLKAVKPRLIEMLYDAVDLTSRQSAATALVAIEPDNRLATLAEVYGDPHITEAIRSKIAHCLASRDAKTVAATVIDVFKLSPRDTQLILAQAMAGDVDGAQHLVEFVTKGVASGQLLLDATVKAKIAALEIPELNQHVAQLTASLPPQNEAIRQLIADRQAAFIRAPTSPEDGKQVFAKTCLACHQLGGKGSLIGPQLDGIGYRGVGRILEDILDPNRNVDVAFQTTLIQTKGGQVLSGLFRREEGDLLVFADNKGKEFTIAKRDIDGRRKSPISLMPENLVESLTKQELLDLLAFLVAEKEAK